jgi:prevent-host-death family protein
MKTATVRDLRNRFADVAKWIEEGEQVTITRHGATFATLAPAKPTKPQRRTWAQRLAERPLLGKKATAEQTAAMWAALRD